MRAFVMCCLVACGGGGDSAQPDAASDASVDPDAASCNGAAGVVTVRAASGTRIVFHDPSGQVVSSRMTSGPTTTETLAPCSMVTLAKVDGAVTVTDVMPGDTITIGVPTPPASNVRNLAVTFPANGTNREFRIGFPGCAFLASTSPVNIAVPEACRVNGSIEMFVLDRNASGALAGFAPISANAATTQVTINAFRTDFSTTLIDVTGVTGMTRFARIATLIDGMDGDTSEQSQTLPATIKYVPGTHVMRTAGAFTGGVVDLMGRDIIAQPLPSIDQFDVATEVPFRITSVDATGGIAPTATWTTTGPLGNVDLAIVCLEWFDNPREYEWCAYVDPKRASFAFPTMPANILPVMPHQTHGAVLVETSVFAGWAAARKDPINRYGRTDGLRYPLTLRTREAILHPALYAEWAL